MCLKHQTFNNGKKVDAFQNRTNISKITKAEEVAKEEMTKAWQISVKISHFLQRHQKWKLKKCMQQSKKVAVVAKWQSWHLLCTPKACKQSKSLNHSKSNEKCKNGKGNEVISNAKIIAKVLNESKATETTNVAQWKMQ